MIVSVLACLMMAIFCFVNGLPLAGALLLIGMIPGLGTLPLVAAAIILAFSDQPVAALFPPLVIAYNLWLAFSNKE